MRIACLVNPDTNNGFYRGILPISALHQAGHDARLVPTDAKRPPVALVRGVDVLLVHRFWDDRAQLLMREARESGAAVVWDDDDDLGASPKGTIAERRHGGMTRQRRLLALKRIFKLVDLVTAPSRTLAERFREHGAAEVEAIENYIPSMFVQRGFTSLDGVTIGWVAGGEHQYDAEQLRIRAVLGRLLDERPDVQVMTVGLGLGFESDRYHHVKWVPLHSSGSERATIGHGRAKVAIDRLDARGLTSVTGLFDIAIAPLADVAFNQARSNIKLKEYAAGGAAWLASPVGPYAAMGEAEGGRLVADDRWHDEISRLLDRPRERRKLAKRAAKWVTGETIEQNASRWERAFARAVERASRINAVV